MNFLVDNAVYVGAVALLGIGLYMVLAYSNLIRMMLGLGIMDVGVNVLLVAIGYVRGGTAPIYTADMAAKAGGALPTVVDPVPQALVLTAIVIGLGVLSLGLALGIRLYNHYGTLDMDKIRGMKW